MDPTANNYDPNATQEDGSCEYPPSPPPCTQIGCSYQGGIIFYLDSTGQHGLIAAKSDQSTGAIWGYYGSYIIGADGTAIGAGQQNTIDIEDGCTIVGTAADICANLILEGYSDWFLPSIDELSIMYYNIGQGSSENIGDFSISHYWSSTEVSDMDAYVFRFEYGNANATNYGKNAPMNVRAVRAF